MEEEILLKGEEGRFPSVGGIWKREGCGERLGLFARV